MHDGFTCDKLSLMCLVFEYTSSMVRYSIFVRECAHLDVLNGAYLRMLLDYSILDFITYITVTLYMSLSVALHSIHRFRIKLICLSRTRGRTHERTQCKNILTANYAPK